MAPKNNQNVWTIFMSHKTYTFMISLLMFFLTYIINRFVDISPSLKKIEDNSSQIRLSQDSALFILKEINSKYTTNSEDGEDIEVGYSSEAKDDYIILAENKTNGFKRGDEIYLTNYVGKYKPSIRLMIVSFAKKNENSKSEEIMYISKEAFKRLDLDINKGVYKLRMKRIVK